MQKLPKFVIPIMIDDARINVQFKSIGDPKNVKILFTPPSKTTFSVVAPLPKEEVISWSWFAKQVYNKQEVLDEGDPRLYMSASKEANGGNSKPKNKAGVLQPLRSAAVQVAPKPKVAVAPKTPRLPNGSDPLIIPVCQARIDVAYKTAASSDPAKQYLARYEGPAKNPALYVIYVYFPNLKDWSRVEVEKDYKLKIQSENSKEKVTMPAKTKSAPQPVPSARVGSAPAANSPVAKTKKGQTVYEAWGQAFAAHGAKLDAPEQITKFMREAFPGRKTLWEKWVNPVRARYNAGKLPGVPAPTVKLKTYKFADKPARSGKERRSKTVKKVTTK